MKNPIKEVGLIDPEGNNFTVELTDEGKKDHLFEGLGHTFKVLHLHGETIELTKDIILLGVGKFPKTKSSESVQMPMVSNATLNLLQKCLKLG